MSTEKPRVLSISQVVSIMGEGLKRAYECSIEIYAQDILDFTFYDHGDDFLTLRVSGRYFTVLTDTTIHEKNLLQLSRVFKKAHNCMEVLGIQPR